MSLDKYFNLVLHEYRQRWQKVFFLLRESGTVEELRRMTVIEFFTLWETYKQHNKEISDVYGRR
mgnify:FL=1